MTVIVSNGLFLYSERRGTATIDVQGRDSRYHRHEQVVLGNISKIKTSTDYTPWSYKGQSILAMGTAGCTEQSERFIDYLNNGYDLDTLVTVSKALKSYLSFDGMSALGILDDGRSIRMLKRQSMLKIDLFASGEKVGVGSGADILSVTDGFFNADIDAFDDFIAAAYLDPSCDLNFDYYDYRNRKLVRDNHLSERQVQHVLNRVQSKIQLYKGPKT